MTRPLLAAAFALTALLPADLAAPSPAQPMDPADEARAAAEAWLALLDEAEYEASWEEAAVIFKDAVTSETWVAQASGIRVQVGTVESRELVGAELMTDPPGAPAGEYARIRFEAEFSGAGVVPEVVVAIHEPERGWRVAGYFLQPPGS